MKYLNSAYVSLPLFIASSVNSAFAIDHFKEEQLQPAYNRLKAHYHGKRDLQEDEIVKRELKNTPIYISLTTSPKRVQYLTDVLSTLDLTHVDKVLINLPEKFGRDGSIYEIPEELINSPKIQIIRTPVDYGPITKLLPGVEYAKSKSPNSIVITIDDDYAYPPGMVNELITYSIYQRMNNERSAISSDGELLSRWKIGSPGFPKVGNHKVDSQAISYDELLERDRNGVHPPLHRNTDVLQGYAGIAYRAEDVDAELMRRLTSKTFSKACFVSDDLVISFVLALSGVNRLQIANRFLDKSMLAYFPFAAEADALCNGAGLEQGCATPDINTEKYQICHRDLIEVAFDKRKGQFRTRNEILDILDSRELNAGVLVKSDELLKAVQEGVSPSLECRIN